MPKSEEMPELTGALRREDVKKHVPAIHVSGKLSLLQRKLSNVLLLNAYDPLVTQSRHRINARTLCLMIGYNSNDMEALKTALRGLAETVVGWDMLNDKGRQECRGLGAAVLCQAERGYLRIRLFPGTGR